MEELRRGREGAQVAESGLQRDPSMHRTRAVCRWGLGFRKGLERHYPDVR